MRDGHPPNRPSPSSGAPLPIRLRKGDGVWIFHYERGAEGRLLARVSELARQADSGLDWVDAALISHEISRRIAANLAAMASDEEEDRL
ncbi:MAG: hypothetical protein D6824_04940 [Planctomycetota bacterium]|nr:MAG: hypothetical protein D6824_04940 [Planctomycetota bacterium]